jgi:putative phosphoribosyl transferase
MPATSIRYGPKEQPMRSFAPHGFSDRRAAGRELASRLAVLAPERPLVLGLARGGIPVAYEIAKALDAQLDVLVARKIGAPDNPEFGIGAVAEGEPPMIDAETVRWLKISDADLDRATARARAEVEERVAHYRGRRPLEITGRTVIVVDDGIATGGTARAALHFVAAQRPRRLVLAVPVGAPATLRALTAVADDVVCLAAPDQMRAVGAWYEDFSQTTDDEVLTLLAARQSAGAATAWRTEQIVVPIGDGGSIVGDLRVPPGATGLVIFAHGSGSSRLSPRNRDVAAVLNDHGLATLLVDLLTPDEASSRANVFDIPLLAGRVVQAARWAADDPGVAALPIGLFGASTGAAAALWGAADLGDRVRTVVSRGGRPDLAAPRLADVHADVLLIVGGRDEAVLALNRDAQRALTAPSELVIVPGATHLFEEPGALEDVAVRAANWFVDRLRGAPNRQGPLP